MADPHAELVTWQPICRARMAKLTENKRKKMSKKMSKKKKKRKHESKYKNKR